MALRARSTPAPFLTLKPKPRREPRYVGGPAVQYCDDLAARTCALRGLRQRGAHLMIRPPNKQLAACVCLKCVRLLATPVEMVRFIRLYRRFLTLLTSRVNRNRREPLIEIGGQPAILRAGDQPSDAPRLRSVVSVRASRRTFHQRETRNSQRVRMDSAGRCAGGAFRGRREYLARSLKFTVGRTPSSSFVARSVTVRALGPPATHCPGAVRPP
jgi:hypothetical protein